MTKYPKYRLVLVLLGLFLTSCEWGFVDKSVTVTFRDNTGSGRELKYVGYRIPGGAWIVCWNNSPGASFNFKVNPGTYTFALFTETSGEDVQSGENGLYALKTVQVTGAVTIVFNPENVTPF